MHLLRLFPFSAITAAGFVPRRKKSKYFESIALYYAYYYDALAFGSSRIMAPDLNPTGGRAVATFESFMRYSYFLLESGNFSSRGCFRAKSPDSAAVWTQWQIR